MNQISLHKIKDKFFQISDWNGLAQKGTIIGIHGITGNHKHFQILAEQLLLDYRFLSYDIRGRGDSSSADMNSSIKMHAEDLISIIESLKINSPILIGHSLGAYIAAMTASMYKPIKAIVLLDGAGVVTEKEKEKIKPALSRLDKVYPSKEAYIKSVKPIYKIMGLEWNKYIAASAEYEVADTGGNNFKFKGSPETIMQDFQSAAQFKHEEICPKITCPALLVEASGNLGTTPLYTREAFEKTIKFTKNIDYVVSSCNHYTIALEPQPVLVNEIAQFLSSIG